MENNFKVRKYQESDFSQWDDFVINKAVNGTFLQTRRFINYHPAGRFNDCSYIVEDSKNNIIAVCPGCLVLENDNLVYFSHKGSTFGGIIISKKAYASASKVLDIISVLENEIKSDGCKKIIYKITPDLFSKVSSDLLEYCLDYHNYSMNMELNSYINYSDYSQNILSEFEQGKRTNVNNCLKAGLIVQKIETDEEIKKFYLILCHTLEKYERKPVHSYEELLLFRDTILPNECEFYGAFLDNEMIAGSMMFLFEDTKVAHTQYLCALHDYDKLSPMTFMYYSMIKAYQEKGYKYISFGITSEHDAHLLNFGLTRSKEAFGSKHSTNLIFEKKLTE
jgi:hypothetical protein